MDFRKDRFVGVELRLEGIAGRVTTAKHGAGIVNWHRSFPV